MSLKTVNDMFTNAKSRELLLLSSFNATFWQEYINNHTKYDKLFRRLYYSYKYFLQDNDDTIDSVTDDFIEDVYNHLLVNSKKYDELYRVYVITNDDYSIIDNYRIKETMDRDTSRSSSDNYGARNDSTTDAIGSQSSSSTGSVSPYDSSSFYNDNKTESSIGERSDTSNFSKGAQSDSHNGNESEDYTLTKVGNIGVQTGTDMLDKHMNLWTRYEFYTLIFKEICKELLLV